MGKWDGWRTVEEFPTYQINSDGDIRNRRTRRILEETQDKHTGCYFYSLHKDGKTYSRNYKKLMYKAWPELLEDWRVIPEHPTYYINKEGKVMSNIQYKTIPEIKGKPGYVRLGGRNGRRYYNTKKFDYSVFDKETV